LSAATCGPHTATTANLLATVLPSRRASNIGDADALMGGTVQGRIAQILGIGLGSCRRCAIAIRQWLRAAYNCGKSADNAQERQYAGMNPKIDAGDRSEKDQDGGDEPQELVHGIPRCDCLCRDRMVRSALRKKCPKGQGLAISNGRYWCPFLPSPGTRPPACSLRLSCRSGLTGQAAGHEPGTPSKCISAGHANCAGQSTSFLAKKYGGMAAAAKALGYGSVTDLQNALASFCAG